jgi:peptide deformylase
MALRDILIWPEEILATKAEAVTLIDAEIQRLATDMIETMYAARGIGLAANQVGVTQRLIVIDLNPLPGEEEEGELRDPAYGPHVMINPEILEREGSLVWEEGCLSVPGEVGEVERAADIVVRYTNLNDEELIVEAHDLMAVCVQHEIDHLNGVVFPERMHDRGRARSIRLAMKQFKSA